MTHTATITIIENDDKSIELKAQLPGATNGASKLATYLIEMAEHKLEAHEYDPAPTR